MTSVKHATTLLSALLAVPDTRGTEAFFSARDSV